MNFQFLLDNSAPIVFICLVMFGIYKLFAPILSKLIVSKEDLNKLNVDINHISQKADNLSVKATTEILNASSNLTEKMRLIQAETIEKADKKYMTRELAEQQTRQYEERMNKLENKLNAMECTLGDVKTVGEINASKLDNIIDILNQQ